MAQLKDDFLDGSSVGYLEQLEAQMAADPTSVHRTWASYLTQLGARPPPPRLIINGALISGRLVNGGRGRRVR